MSNQQTGQPNYRLALIVMLAVYILASGAIPLPWINPQPDTPVVTTPKATAATYVYEKDQTAVPPPVSFALNRLNREKGVVATLFEDDTTDGTGEIPDQYRVPVTAARAAGLPALVVTGGDTVLNVVKNPKTEQETFEAVP